MNSAKLQAPKPTFPHSWNDTSAITYANSVMSVRRPSPATGTHFVCSYNSASGSFERCPLP